MVEGAPIEKPLFEGGLIGPIKGEANHVFSMNEEERNNYVNFTDKLKIGSTSLVAVGSVVGGIVLLDRNESMPQSLFEILGIVGLGVIGYIASKFRQKAYEKAIRNS